VVSSTAFFVPGSLPSPRPRRCAAAAAAAALLLPRHEGVEPSTGRSSLALLGQQQQEEGRNHSPEGRRRGIPGSSRRSLPKEEAAKRGREGGRLLGRACGGG